jgi:hypothetical protein
MKGNVQHLNGNVSPPISKLEGTGIPAIGYWSVIKYFSTAEKLAPYPVSARSRTAREWQRKHIYAQEL